MKRRTFLASVVFGGPLSAGSLAAADRPLRIATFQADVTPPLGAVLCHGNVAPAKQIVERLTARGIVLFAEPSPVVLCSVDWVGIGNEAHDAWREALARAVGTSPDRVSVHVVHQHDAPGIDFSTEKILAAHGLGGKMFDVQFAKDAIQRAAQAAAAAKPAPVTHLGYGQGKVEKVASNRRILGPDGRCTMTRMSSCRNEAARAAPEGIVDPYVRLLSFWDGSGPLVAMTYYACHPQSYYGQGGVSVDFVGLARNARQAALGGVFCIHFDGAGGDVAAGKYNDGSPANRPILARRLEQGMKAAWESAQKVPIRAGDVRWRVCPVQLPLRATIDEAKSLQRLDDKSLPQRERIFAARDMAFAQRMKSGHRIGIGCLHVGPAMVLHMPGELCVQYQLAAQEMRPDRFVAMAAYGDLGPGYIAREVAYSQGGYEVSRVSRVSPDVEGVLTAAMRELLGQKGVRTLP